MNLTNQTVLVTGATSGIGLHLAIRLHKMGNKVLICGRNQQRLDAIAAAYPGIHTYMCDVREVQERVALADWAIREHPDLNILVNNAGLMKLFDLTKDTDLDKVTEEINTNLIAPIHLTGLFTVHLQKQTQATIINVTSGLAFTPLASVPVYCATKAGLHSFTKSLRYQLKDTSVKVFEIIPPAVDTSLGKADGYEQAKESAMKLDDFINEVIQVLEQNTYEIGIGIAEGLHQQRDGLFSMLNP